MAGIFHTLNIGAESLYASRQGVDTAGHNIANAHTEGFSRQRVNLEQREPSETRGIIIGNGAFIKNITRAHDRFLEKQINVANKDVGYSHGRHESLLGIEGIYSPELQASVSDEISQFFRAVQELSNFPEELTVRTHARESALNTVNAFRRIDESLRNVQRDLNERLIGEASEINKLVNQIAGLNKDILTLEVGEARMANDLRDQQDRLIRDLSQRIDIAYYRGDNGMTTIRGPGEVLLVDRGHAVEVEAQIRNEEGGFADLVVIDSSGVTKNLRHVLKGGQVKGIMDVRDAVIEDLLQRNNMMAKTMADGINSIHRQGFGLGQFKDSIGRSFFNISDDLSQAARSIKINDVIAEDTDAISVAASPFAPGDNVLANEMLRLENAKIMDGDSSLVEYYANYVGVLGLDLVRSDHLKQSNDILLSELQSRREAVSGVSMDEEAMNLLRWQANFTASSKVITTADEMLETVLSLKR